MRDEFAIPPQLERVPVPAAAGDVPVPRFVDSFIRDAEDRAEAYGGEVGQGRFVPGDVRYVYQVLQWLLRTHRTAPGAAFLEWGSGQGLATILAGTLGYEAMGVEIDDTLVQESRRLAARYDVRVRFAQGTYDPLVPGRKMFTAARRAAVYAYPWPGEEPRLLQLFAANADAGAFLLLGLGPEDVRVYRQREG